MKEPEIRSPAAARPFLSILVLALSFACLAAAFTMSSPAFHDYPLIVPAHVFLVLTLVLGCMLAAGILRRDWNARPWIAMLPLTIISVVVAELYLLNVFAWAFSIDFVSLDVIRAYHSNVAEMLSQVLPAVPPVWFLVPLVVAAAVPIVVLSLSVSTLHRAMIALESKHWTLLPNTRSKSVGLGFLIAYGVAFAGCVWIVSDLGHLYGEPFSSLIFPPRTGNLTRLPRNYFSSARYVPEQSHVAVKAPPDSSNVVVIVVDALRADHLPLYGYPRTTTPLLSRRLANTPALVAERASSSCSISGCGILSILTSKPYRRLQYGLPSLHAALRGAGYKTYFEMSGDFSKAWKDLSGNLAADADVFKDGFSSSNYTPYDDRGVIERLRELPDHSEQPAFFYIHLMSAHAAGTLYRTPTYLPVRDNWFAQLITTLPVLRRFSPPERIETEHRQVVLNNYDNRILQVDEVVDQVLNVLRTKGYLDHSVVVLTADHGESLGEHGVFTHGKNLYTEETGIPLIVMDTDFTSDRRVDYATQLEIAPTIADLVGIPAPRSWEGQSLLKGVPEFASMQTTSILPIQGVIWHTSRATYQYLFDTQSGVEELFDVVGDPGENRNLVRASDSSLVDRLRQIYAGQFRDTRE